MRAGQAAAAAGVTVKALRYYEKIGLLLSARRSNGYRDYTDDDVRLTAEIRALSSLELSPLETQPFLQCLRAGHQAGDDCPESLVAYQETLDRLDGLIARLPQSREQVAKQLRIASRRGFRVLAHEEEALSMTSSMPQPAPCPRSARSRR